MITAAQLRAARALLGLDQRRLAELSGLSDEGLARDDQTLLLARRVNNLG